MTKEIRNRLIAKLHILITQQGVDKDALYSSFGVESATQMSDSELVECVSLLEGKTTQSPYSPKVKTNEYAIRQTRSEILSLITKSPNAKAIKSRGLGVPNDWSVLNPFIKKLAGKRLNELSFDEMEHFKKQLFKMRDKGWVWSSVFHGDQFSSAPAASPSASIAEPNPLKVERATGDLPPIIFYKGRFLPS